MVSVVDLIEIVLHLVEVDVLVAVVIGERLPGPKQGWNGREQERRDGLKQGWGKVPYLRN